MKRRTMIKVDADTIMNFALRLFGPGGEVGDAEDVFEELLNILRWEFADNEEMEKFICKYYSVKNWGELEDNYGEMVGDFLKEKLLS